jgi:hypothetical protein
LQVSYFRLTCPRLETSGRWEDEGSFLVGHMVVVLFGEAGKVHWATGVFP